MKCRIFCFLVDDTCNITLDHESGVHLSPNYDNKHFPGNTTCKYQFNITSTANKDPFLYITFSNFYLWESDTITVYNGKEMEGLIGSFSGRRSKSVFRKLVSLFGSLLNYT